MVYFNATQYLHIGRPYKCKFYFTMFVWMFPNCKKAELDFLVSRMCKCFVWCSVCCSTQTRLFLCTCLRHQCQSFAFQHDRPPNVKIPRKKRKEIEMSLGQQKTPLTSELFSTPQKNTTPRPRPPPVLDHQTIHVPFQIFLVQLLHACFSQYYQFPIGHLNLLLPCFNSFCGRAF